MSSNVRVTPHPSFDVLAATTAARLITRLLDVQGDRGEATVVLTGGSVGIATLREVAKSPARLAVDWGKVNIWFGDERFVETNSPDRNCGQAAQALLDQIPVDPARVHIMAASDTVASLDEAVQKYAAELAAAAKTEWLKDDDAPEQEPVVPRFDVLLLGLGPDAHIASLFPDMAGIRTKGVSVVGVTNSPKPPASRVSLTLETINSAQEIWIVAAGADKAAAVGLGLAGANEVQVPASGARGLVKTLWLLDEAAAAKVPSALMRREN
ncbi:MULTISPECIES: 6-phosphogluconolactonase [Arthrobacter]|uniref:6-phosphogluconolactonase n=1 Tax=Arthrobacter psychrochitiniphilus TaxID=291045 RepID=A0A2V3DQU0_9MICC|nr:MULTISPECIES: 6-phosphogluconolactonase [Arthrobacter]NYG17554.1 6-phosphogluconolactonase [Arthrobacter psychrochitiniphilus]PXA64656.1 6-phosphogluconolactonase [Arthrobacter psychrochitiniphilus]